METLLFKIFVTMGISGLMGAIIIAIWKFL